MGKVIGLAWTIIKMGKSLYRFKASCEYNGKVVNFSFLENSKQEGIETLIKISLGAIEIKEFVTKDI